MEKYDESIVDGDTGFTTVYSSGCFHCFDYSTVCENKRERELRGNIQRCVRRPFYGTFESSQLVLRRKENHTTRKAYIVFFRIVENMPIDYFCWT